jgi:hypothetical protein
MDKPRAPRLSRRRNWDLHTGDDPFFENNLTLILNGIPGEGRLFPGMDPSIFNESPPSFI